jgi:hypothetical protein
MTIPFSPYDFFGYLANGFIIVCSFEYALFGTSLAERDWKVGIAVFYTILSYIIGHIVATLPRRTDGTRSRATSLMVGFLAH